MLNFLKHANIKVADYLWGTKARPAYLFFAAVIMMLMMLGMRELWTQEWRWANISWHMIYSGDYLHPYLAGAAYYDKPLLSYWLMIIFSRLLGDLNEWTLRLPAALAGILAVWSTYRLGWKLVDKRVGLIAGWMLVTTYFFVFWARTANADMLNLAGTMFAVWWYFEHKDQQTFKNYLIFFLTLAITGLFKGLIGIVIPLLAVAVDLCRHHEWKKHLRWSLLFAIIPPVIIYLLPFWASTLFGGGSYSENGLYEVYRENIMRYFSPFDHEGPIYTYLIYLPVYMLPWALFFIPTLYFLPTRWKKMKSGSRWMALATAVIFVFLTLSGSRRNYYVLPLVPFATLMTADWIASVSSTYAKIDRLARYMVLFSFSVLFLIFGVIQPLYYCNGGLRSFASNVHTTASAFQPWSSWNIVFLDALSKLTLYMDPSRPVQMLNPPGGHADDQDRAAYTIEQLTQAWPILKNPPPHTLFITREIYAAKLAPLLKDYKVVMAPHSLGERLLHENNLDMPVAFIPKD